MCVYDAKHSDGQISIPTENCFTKLMLAKEVIHYMTHPFDQGSF
jgi:hypothetical protein